MGPALLQNLLHRASALPSPSVLLSQPSLHIPSVMPSAEQASLPFLSVSFLSRHDVPFSSLCSSCFPRLRGALSQENVPLILKNVVSEWVFSLPFETSSLEILILPPPPPRIGSDCWIQWDLYTGHSVDQMTLKTQHDSAILGSRVALLGHQLCPGIYQYSHG